MTLDFTLDKLQELYKAISNSHYTPLTIEEYISSERRPERFIIIRHDIDFEPAYSLKLAKIEKEFGITSTYYFRATEDVFQPEIIKSIADLGYEIGYHYEVLDKAKGDYNQAIKIYEKELNKFRQIYDVKTICPHGSPIIGTLSPYSFSGMFTIAKTILQRRDVFTSRMNQDLWKKYDFKQFDIIGDAYLSIDFGRIMYFSDTGRNWNSTRYKIRDVIGNSASQISEVKINCTDDLIELIKQGEIKNIYILIHANHWKDNFGSWLKWLILIYIRNISKLGLKWYMKTTKIKLNKDKR